LTTVAELLPILEAVVAQRKPLLIIAKDIVAEALSALILNMDRGAIPHPPLLLFILAFLPRLFV
jgi:chaperonin GroEL